MVTTYYTEKRLGWTIYIAIIKDKNGFPLGKTEAWDKRGVITQEHSLRKKLERTLGL